MTPPPSWWIYHGTRPAPDPHAIDRLLVRPAPSWRTFDGEPLDRARGDAKPAATFQPLADEVELVNAAILLRRPLLVTGKPGCGKSSLAKSIAWELALGSLLTWPINTRSTITEGLYRYDAIARLQDASIPRAEGDGRAPEVARYLRLGPLGEALLPARKPRVLLIDEIDKSDVDLPNDLLNVLEEGRFEIPELLRLKGTGARLAARAGDGDEEVALPDGAVQCAAFPIIVMTSNGERDFPPAFLRRCVQVRMTEPEPERLKLIVEAHLQREGLERTDALLAEFLGRRSRQTLSTDQLLNAVYLATQGVDVAARKALLEAIFRAISGET